MDNQSPVRYHFPDGAQLTVDVPPDDARWRFLERGGLKMVASHVLFGEQVVLADKTITAVWKSKDHDRFVTIPVTWIVNREDFRENNPRPHGCI